MAVQHTEAYRRIQALIVEDRCVILDGGVATELERVGLKDYRISDKGLWGTWALYHTPHVVQEVHHRFVQAGCDLISTNTWAILSTPEMETTQFDGARRAGALDGCGQAGGEAGAPGC